MVIISTCIQMHLQIVLCCIYILHYFHNTVFKKKHKLHIYSGSIPLPCPPSKILCVCLLTPTRYIRSTVSQNTAVSILELKQHSGSLQNPRIYLADCTTPHTTSQNTASSIILSQAWETILSMLTTLSALLI